MKRPRLSKTITIFRRNLGRARINILLVKPLLNRFRKSDNLGSLISKPAEVLPTLDADSAAWVPVAVTDSSPEQDAPATIPSHQEQAGNDLVDPTLVEEIFAGSSLPAAESNEGDVLSRSDAGEQGAPATASPELTGEPTGSNFDGADTPKIGLDSPNESPSESDASTELLRMKPASGPQVRTMVEAFQDGSMAGSGNLSLGTCNYESVISFYY